MVGVEVEEDDTLGGHVDSEGERGIRDDHLDKGEAEEVLHQVAVGFGNTGMIDGHTSEQEEEEGVARIPGILLKETPREYEKDKLQP